MHVPRLVTHRLVLRGFDAADFEAYASMMADPSVARHLGDGQALGRADAWRQLALIVGHWSLRGFGLWDMEPSELDYHFLEFRPFLGQCRFSDCTHHNEPKCAIVEAVERGEIARSRYDSFLVLYDETDPAHERHY